MPSSHSPAEQNIIIQGVTLDGQIFRPSDWAERMCGDLSTMRNNRIQYNPMLVPMTNAEGHKCILLDPQLQKCEPEFYQSILDFAQKNKLRVSQEMSFENAACPIG